MLTRRKFLLGLGVSAPAAIAVSNLMKVKALAAPLVEPIPAGEHWVQVDECFMDAHGSVFKVVYKLIDGAGNVKDTMSIPRREHPLTVRDFMETMKNG